MPANFPTTEGDTVIIVANADKRRAACKRKNNIVK